jgi:hypothetical protein
MLKSMLQDMLKDMPQDMSQGMPQTREFGCVLMLLASKRTQV